MMMFKIVGPHGEVFRGTEGDAVDRAARLNRRGSTIEMPFWVAPVDQIANSDMAAATAMDVEA